MAVNLVVHAFSFIIAAVTASNCIVNVRYLTSYICTATIIKKVKNLNMKFLVEFF